MVRVCQSSRSCQLSFQYLFHSSVVTAPLVFRTMSIAVAIKTLAHVGAEVTFMASVALKELRMLFSASC